MNRDFEAWNNKPALAEDPTRSVDRTPPDVRTNLNAFFAERERRRERWHDRKRVVLIAVLTISAITILVYSAFHQ